MTALSPHDVVGNCRMAFDAAECLGIPRVIEPRDMSLLAVPDKLAVMTYLYQLRAHFTGHQLQIEQIGNTSDESSYVIGNYKTDNLSSQNILSFDHIKKKMNRQSSLDEEANRSDERSPTDKKDVKNLILSGSKHLLGKVLSPSKDKNHAVGSGGVAAKTPSAGTPTQQNEKEKPFLMSRRELNDPFGSDDEDEQKSVNSVHTMENQRNSCNMNRDDSPTAPPNLDPVTANVSTTKHTENDSKLMEHF